MPDVLKDKQYITYSRLSRYNNDPVYYHSKDGKYIYGTTSYLNDNTVYSLYEVRRGDTLDTLALKYYNNPTFFWIIASFNRLDPYEDLIVGQQLKIPSYSSLKFVEEIRG